MEYYTAILIKLVYGKKGHEKLTVTTIELYN